MQNELSEFFNMVNFCNPGVLGNPLEFRECEQSGRPYTDLHILLPVAYLSPTPVSFERSILLTTEPNALACLRLL